VPTGYMVTMPSAARAGKVSMNVFVVVVSQPATFFKRRASYHWGACPCSHVASSEVAQLFIDEETLPPRGRGLRRKVMRRRSRVTRWTLMLAGRTTSKNKHQIPPRLRSYPDPERHNRSPPSEPNPNTRPTGCHLDLHIGRIPFTVSG
jgi:hypothetical protein